MGGRNSAKLLTASKRSGDKMVTMVLLDIRMKWFELVADAQEVGIYRCRLDMAHHINSVEAESIRS